MIHFESLLLEADLTPVERFSVTIDGHKQTPDMFGTIHGDDFTLNDSYRPEVAKMKVVEMLRKLPRETRLLVWNAGFHYELLRKWFLTGRDTSKALDFAYGGIDIKVPTMLYLGKSKDLTRPEAYNRIFGTDKVQPSPAHEKVDMIYHLANIFIRK